MNIETILRGYLKETSGVVQRFPEVRNPGDNYIEDTIKKIALAGFGTLRTECNPIPNIGPQELELYVDEDNFLLMLSEIDESGEHNVRTIYNKNMPGGFMFFFGEGFPAKAVTQDINIVIDAFKEFARSGDVHNME